MSRLVQKMNHLGRVIPYTGCAALILGIIVVLSHPATLFSEQPSSGVTLPKTARLSERVYSLPGLTNVGRVSASVFRGAQPQEQGYATLKEMGIKTVLNLRSRHSEKARVEKAGLRSIEVPVDTLKEIRRDDVLKAVAVLTDPANQPVFVHCQYGKDRTGVVVAIYRMDIDGWSLAEAEAEMQTFGFNDVWVNLKNFLRRYAKEKGK